MRQTPRPPQHRRPPPPGWPRALTCLLGLGVLLASLSPPAVRPADPLAEAIGRLKTEQTLAESAAGLLKGVGKPDVAPYARGIQRYAAAKAEFDGLLEQLLAALHRRDPPDASPAFHQRLETAAQRRVAFTAFIDQEVISKVPQGTRSVAAILAIPGVISGVTELATGLKDATGAIWHGYRQGVEQERAALVSQLEALRWKPFEAITPLH
jgi:hypothetical protein